MAEGIAGALGKKADRDYEEKKKQHEMISNMVSKGIESGTIKDPEAAFQFLISGGKQSKKPKDLPPMIKQLIGSTKHLFGGKGDQPSEADQVAGRMASAQKPQGQPSAPKTPQFTSGPERDAQANASALDLAKKTATDITEPAAAKQHTRRMEEIGEQNKGKYGVGTLVGRVNAEIDSWKEAHPGEEPDAATQSQLVDKARAAWQGAGKKDTDYKSFENTWLEDAAKDGALTPGQKKVEMLKARKAWSLQESSADKLSRAKSLAKYKNDLEAVSGNDVKDLSQTVTIGDKSTGYLDLSAIAGAKEKNAAAKAAIAQGIIPVTGKQAEMLEGAGAASGNLKDFMTAIESKLPKDPSGRVVSGVENKLSQFFQTDEELAAAMSWDVTVLPLLRAMQVSGRITNLEFQTALNARPKITDTYGSAQKKVADLNGILNRSASQVLTRGQGGSSTPKTGAAGGEVPAGVAKALKGASPGHHVLKNKSGQTSEWDVDAKGNITPGKKAA
jgi:hypothetical protein